MSATITPEASVPVDRMKGSKSILVTGAHRSGTTWVGKMIAASPRVYYIQEPFNVDYPPRPGISRTRMHYWFTYISEENADQYYRDLQETLACRYDLRAEWSSLRSSRDVLRMLRDSLYSTYSRFTHKSPLVKDPIALFSAEWLAETFDMDVVVMIRHPAAFASSIKRLNWKHDFTHFLHQPRLMNEYLAPFAAQIVDFATHEHDILEQAALLWNIMYYRVSHYKRLHNDWIFLRHEDASMEPLHHFEYLYKRLGLDFSAREQAVIREYSDSSNAGKTPEKSKAVVNTAIIDKRDSKAAISSWKKNFTATEISWLREQVEDVAHEFYSDSDW
ncbi:MAG TPA: sulfotransferase [Ktedonobacteraceae bacterium]|nr:sulfotransferase [Ktedonobacteraceae bacterium]